MSRLLHITVAILCLLARNHTHSETPPQAPLQPLKISENGRFLVHTDDTPFFYLADTAWELFHRLNREEADRYLRNRSEKGFTVIQAVVLAEIEGLTQGNAYGDLPFIDMDASRPNENYFAHVDWIVNRAASRGLYVGLLPGWGRWVGGDDAGQTYNDFINVDNASAYGAYLAKRYAGKPIIWILGGDRLPHKSRATWEAMAAGIRSVVGQSQLITYHPAMGYNGELHDAPWLDFNMIQSAHSLTTTNYLLIERDYARVPAKPCMDSEPAYEFPPGTAPETIAVGPVEVRRNAYWALFAGAHGHTYGTHPIWQMYDVGRESLWYVQTPWHQSMDLAGANQLAYVKRLMRSRPFLTRIPDQTLITSEIPQGLARIQATRDGHHGLSDATYLVVYFPQHASATINTRLIAGDTLAGSWFNPRTGESTQLASWENSGSRDFSPPTNVAGEDWILIVDDASKHYGAP